jgi:hypothetical protein
MVTMLGLLLVSAVSTATGDQDLPPEQSRSSAVEPGIKGGCIGGGIGFCLGFGPLGACGGCLLGNYIENMQTDVDALTKEKQEREDEAYEKGRQACEKSKQGLNAREADRISCPTKRGFPFWQVGLGGAGMGLAVVVGLVGLGLAVLSLVGGIVLAGGALGATGLLLGFGGMVTLGVLGLVGANVTGLAMMAPLVWHLFKVWWDT